MSFDEVERIECLLLECVQYGECLGLLAAARWYSDEKLSERESDFVKPRASNLAYSLGLRGGTHELR